MSVSNSISLLPLPLSVIFSLSFFSVSVSFLFLDVAAFLSRSLCPYRSNWLVPFSWESVQILNFL